MSDKKIIIGDVSIKTIVKDGMLQFNITADNGDADTAIDTMLLAVLHICTSNGIDSADIITRTAFRMSELAKTVVVADA